MTGTPRYWLGKLLPVHFNGLRALLQPDTCLQRVCLDLTAAHNVYRVGRVTDVIAPRTIVAGGEDFPSVLGQIMRAGGGQTCAPTGVTVVIMDQQIETHGSLALINMYGRGAALMVFAHTDNRMISAWPAIGVRHSEDLSAFRPGGLKAAVYLAQGAAAFECFHQGLIAAQF